MPDHQHIRVFLGSAMTELRDVREIVDKALEEHGLDAVIYETDVGARPETVRETSLSEVRNSDVFAGLFWREHPSVTVEEYKEARRLDKPCFVGSIPRSFLDLALRAITSAGSCTLPARWVGGEARR